MVQKVSVNLKKNDSESLNSVQLGNNINLQSANVLSKYAGLERTVYEHMCVL